MKLSTIRYRLSQAFRLLLEFINYLLHVKLREKTRELSEKMDEVKERTKMVKESEDKKEELKSRALDTIKE